MRRARCPGDGLVHDVTVFDDRPDECRPVCEFRTHDVRNLRDFTGDQTECLWCLAMRGSVV